MKKLAATKPTIAETYKLYQSITQKWANPNDLAPLIIDFDKESTFTPRYARKKWAQFCANPKNLELYGLKRFFIDIPYCKGSICHYCKYKSNLLKSDSQLREYMEYLTDYLRYFSPALRNVKFSLLYVGGGTPSVLSAAQIRELIAVLRSSYDFTGLDAFTYEMHPSHWNPGQVKALKDGGCTRISMGVQSLNPKLLASVNRANQQPDHVTRLIDCGRKYGIAHINTDMLLGLQGDTLESLLSGVEFLMKQGSDSIAVYTLTVDSDLRGGYGELGVPYAQWRDSLEKAFGKKIIPLAASYKYAVYANSMGFTLVAAGKNLNPTDYDRNNEITRIEFGAGRHSISYMGDQFEYCEQIAENKFKPAAATLHGREYSSDERIARYCLRFIHVYGKLDLKGLKNRFGINAAKYFSKPLALLKKMGRIKITDSDLSFCEKNTRGRSGDILFLSDSRTAIVQSNKLSGRKI